MELLTGPLADVLRRGRLNFNARSAAATRAESPLDAEAFQRHLAFTLDPIVRSSAAEFPERTEPLVEALYDLSLDLFRQNLLGPKAKYPAIPEAWEQLLSRIPHLLARDPLRVAGAVTNALYNLSRTPGADPRLWISALSEFGGSSSGFLDCGAILAWRCGMPQYRKSALQKAASLPPSLAAQALGVPEERVADVIRALQANPWVQPQDTFRENPKSLHYVAKVGAFRGFGGQFLTPPKVECIDGELVATDGTGSWHLHADIFNAVLLRREQTGPPPLPPDIAKSQTTDSDARIAADGTLRWLGMQKRFPELAHATSIASTRDTVAVTIPTSHHLYLVGLA